MAQINPVQRIHLRMEQQVNEILEYRKNNGMKKLTFVQVTNLIVRHENWLRVKNDIVEIKEYKENGK